MSSQNARNFFITMNEAVMSGYEDTIDYLKKRKCNYFISCLEENKREKLHIHIYVQFPNQVKLAYSKCSHADVRVCKGTEDQNVAYVSKIKRAYGVDNILEEYGTIRHGCGKNQHTLMASELKELPFDEVPANQYRTWQSLQGFDSMTKNEMYKPDVKVWFVYGPSGAGKTKWVFDHLEDDEKYDPVKFDGRFWQSVNVINQPETAWYEEFRSSQMPAYEFIMFIDYYVHTLNVKYFSGVKNKYKKIFITSIEDPEEIYTNLPKEARLQWLRRIEKVPIGVSEEEK